MGRRRYPTDTRTHLNNRERLAVRKMIRTVVESVLKRERSPLKRSLLLERLSGEVAYEKALYIASVAGRTKVRLAQKAD